MLSKFFKKIPRISDRILLFMLIVSVTVVFLQQIYIWLPKFIPLPENAFINDEEQTTETLQAVYRLQIWDKEENELTEYAYGSAFTAFDNGIFVTCNHCIESTDDLYILLGEDEQQTHYVVNRVLIQDEEHDLALIECKALSKVEPLKISTEKLHYLQPVILISSPAGTRNGIENGAVRSSTANRIMTSPIGDAGSSGGPLFNIGGEVLGIMRAGEIGLLGDDKGSAFVPISYAEELYNQWLATGDTEQQEDHYTITLPGGPKTEDNNFVFSIG